MSRRCYSRNSEQLPPFADNLVFWAPLTQGDLTDHISGASPTTDSRCTIDWDADKGMYLFSFDSGASINLATAAQYAIQNVSLNEATCYIYAQTLRRQGNNYEGWINANNVASGAICNLCGYRVSAVATASNITTINPSGLHKFVCVYKGSKLLVYQDGTLVRTHTWSSVSTPYTLNSVGLCVKQKNQTYLSEYIRDVRIYNVALTAQEVAQL